MVCLGLKPGAAVWKTQTNPLSYGVTPNYLIFLLAYRPTVSSKVLAIKSKGKSCPAFATLEAPMVIGVTMRLGPTKNSEA